MNVADDSPFDIANFTPTWLIGEGVWGRVYDLGDGTVLKIARESARASAAAVRRSRMNASRCNCSRQRARSPA